MKNILSTFFLLVILFFALSCSKEKAMERPTHFEKMLDTKTGVDFRNDLPYSEEFNTYTYRNFYNGGGVAIGDINNDGLADIYFTGNIVDSKLYLNKGNWEFEDITSTAGVACQDVWSTGATMADINGDGLLDIYVCKAGKPGGQNRYNELFINQGDLTFKESAKAYGLDVVGLSIHSAFFDYDKDGDLDCYLLNNSIRSVGGFDFQEGLRNIPDNEGNKFFRNDDGKFVNITQEAGLYSSNIGYGLGITLADFNLDNWPDIFISNDFFERDYYYINNHDGTFKEIGDESFFSLSMGSMGADACDIDNDMLPDLFVTEMLPHSLERKRTKTQYETWDKYSLAVSKGYGHQFSRNSLQKNIGDNKFLEIGRFAGVAATEWSWASLIQDFDNDGLKDLFVSNGIYKDLLDKDYLNFIANDVMISSKIAKNEAVLTSLIDSMPSIPIRNYLFKNVGEFGFNDVAKDWGLEEATFSNGSAYGDLDNDGDLDLVVNNVNMPSHIYRNNCDTSQQRFIQFTLKGNGKNTKALGAKLFIYHRLGQSMFENYTSKGFESTVDNKIHFGVGAVEKIDSARIVWPSGKETLLTNLSTNQLYKLDENDAGKSAGDSRGLPSSKNLSNIDLGFTHEDVNINLFSRERLLLEMNGFRGPALAVADLNGDEIEDVFIGGGKLQSSSLYLSSSESAFTQQLLPFSEDSKSESVKAVFSDIDNDGDLDLYVANGGYSVSAFSQNLSDILYLNKGNGEFEKSNTQLIFPFPINTGDVKIQDLDQDGLKDIVVAEQGKNNAFGIDGGLFVFKNLGQARFELLKIPALQALGMISSLELLDLNSDGWLDIVMAGKWMPITIAYSDKGNFSNNTKLETIEGSSGLWNDLVKRDIDGDGDEDLLCGNIGLNSFYHPNMKVFIKDFDGNGRQDQIFCEELNGKYFPVHEIDELFSQLPILKKKLTLYNTFAQYDLATLFSEQLINEAKTLELNELRHMVLLNQGESFTMTPLPFETQFSSVHAITFDESTEGHKVFLGGNSYKVKPQFGRQDASMGWEFDAKFENGEMKFGKPKSLFVKGQIRALEMFNNQLIIGLNDGPIEIITR